jgi:uncharacterized protein YuzE
MSVLYALYDPEADALEVRLSQKPVARTVSVTDLHMVDLDAEGRPVAIEILVPNDPRLDEIAAEFGLDDQVPAIRAAIEKAMAATRTFSGSLPNMMVVEQFTYHAAAVPVLTVGPLPMVSGSAASAVAGEVAELTLTSGRDD